MSIKVSKYHGLGNDFILTRYDETYDIEKLVRACCDRHTGIGADGMIFVKENPLEMVYYNQDGSRAPMCGNGIRCFAAYCFDEGSCTDEKIPVQTLAGEKIVYRVSENPFVVRVDMEEPIYSNALLNVDENESVWKRNLHGVDTYSLFMATVHTVVFVDEAFNEKNVELGKLICHDSFFKKQTNVNFVQVKDRNHIVVMTYERGCGITLACGTGACASVVVANKLGLTDEHVDVELKIGHLQIDLEDHVFMSGPAKKIIEGEYDYE